MKKNVFIWSFAATFYFLFTSIVIAGTGNNIKPVSPKASPEAIALLDYFYSISGKYILSGQHNYPNTKDHNTQFAASYIGKTPVIFSTDWGFAKEDDTDSYLARPDIVAESIRQHKLGAIVTICWHAVPPTADEPVTFRPLPGASPDSLASIQGQLVDQQFIDLLTPGTAIYKHWCAQVDTIANYLKQLQDAHVPVLWRPYHEMNGDWFWWGGRTGKYSTVALYNQLFDRLVNYHKLNNLIWIWSVDRPVKPGMEFSLFYPGEKRYDIAGLDVYRNDFNQTYYDSLKIIANGKPMVLAEVGNPPSLEIMKSQPGWSYFATWASLTRNTSKSQYNLLTQASRVLFLEDSLYKQSTTSYRSECQLSPLWPVTNNKIDVSGKWVFDEAKSSPSMFGLRDIPYTMVINQTGDSMSLRKTFILEYADNKITEESVKLNGIENLSTFMDMPRNTTAKYSQSGDSVLINHKISIHWGDKPFEMIVEESWTLKDFGKTLYIQQYSKSRWGENNLQMIYNKKESYEE